MFGFFCKLIGHRRSRKRAYNVEGDWRSFCKRCAVPLERVDHNDWRVMTHEPNEKTAPQPQPGGTAADERAPLAPS